MAGGFLCLDPGLRKVRKPISPVSKLKARIYRVDRDDILGALGSKLETLQMQKSVMGWDLEGLEAATRVEVQDRDSDSDDSSSE